MKPVFETERLVVYRTEMIVEDRPSETYLGFDTGLSNSVLRVRRLHRPTALNRAGVLLAVEKTETHSEECSYGDNEISGAG